MVIGCCTPVLGRRSRLGRSLVSWLSSAVARRSVDPLARCHRWLHCAVVLLLIRRRPRHTTSSQIPPIDHLLKKQCPVPCTLPPPGFAVMHPTNTTFYSRSLARNHHIPPNPNIPLQKALDHKCTLGYAPISCTTTIHQ